MPLVSLLFKAVWPYLKTSIVGKDGIITLLKKRKMTMFLTFAFIFMFVFFLYMFEQGARETSLVISEKETINKLTAKIAELTKKNCQ